MILLAVGVLLPAALVRQSRDQLVLGRLVENPWLAVGNTLTQGYSPRGLLSGIAPAWSLAVEVVFYLALPLLGLLAVVGPPGGYPDKAAAGRAGPSRVAAGGRPIGPSRGPVPDRGRGDGPGWNGDWHSVIVRSFWARADLFTFGMALAVVHVGLRQGWCGCRIVGRCWRWPTRPCSGSRPCMLVDRGLIDKSMYAYQLPTSLACTLLLAVVVLPGRAARPSLLVGLLTSRPLVAVGLASYSLFLWHDPLLRLLHERGLTMDGSGGLVVNLAVLGLLSGLLSALTYRYVERPALRARSAANPSRPTRPVSRWRRRTGAAG